MTMYSQRHYILLGRLASIALLRSIAGHQQHKVTQILQSTQASFDWFQSLCKQANYIAPQKRLLAEHLPRTRAPLQLSYRLHKNNRKCDKVIDSPGYPPAIISAGRSIKLQKPPINLSHFGDSHTDQSSMHEPYENPINRWQPELSPSPGPISLWTSYIFHMLSSISPNSCKSTPADLRSFNHFRSASLGVDIDIQIYQASQYIPLKMQAIASAGQQYCSNPH